MFTDKLKIKGATEYNYLNQSDCLVLNGVDDAKKFHMLMVIQEIRYIPRLWFNSF